MSLETSYLNEIADKFDSDLDNVLVNDSLVVNVFDVKQVTANIFEAEFTVLKADTAQIDNIKLRKSDNSLISDEDVDIPITEEEIEIKYKYTISEVISS